MAAAADPHVPIESTFRSSPRRIAGIVLGALLGLATVNAAVLFYVDSGPARISYVTQRKWCLLAEQTHPVDWLILGDSTGMCGLDPDAVQRQLGGRALNLCASAKNCVLGDAWLLEEHIRRLGPPRGVIVVHTFDIWWRSIALDVVSDMPARVVQASSVSPVCFRGVRSTLKLLWYRYVPLDSRIRSLARLLRGGELLNRAPYEFRANGLVPMLVADPPVVLSGYAAMRTHVREHAPFVMSEDNRRAVRRLVELADQYRFPVYFVSGPLYEELVTDGPFKRYLEQLRADLAALCAPSPYAHCLVDFIPTFRSDQLQNNHHVIVTAVAAFSEQTLTRIRAVDALTARPASLHDAPPAGRAANSGRASAGRPAASR